MLAGSSVGPFAGGALPAVRPGEAHVQAAPRRVRDIADDPVATPATAVREVTAAHCFGITRETACQISGLRSHVAHAAALSAMRTSGCRSTTLARMSGPDARIGTNRRSFHEMISEVRPIVFNGSTMPSVKPESSMRNSPIALARRSSRPS